MEKSKIEYKYVKLDSRAHHILKEIKEKSNIINSYSTDYKTNMVEILSRLIVKEYEILNQIYEKYKEYIEENGEESYRKIVNGDFDIDMDVDVDFDLSQDLDVDPDIDFNQ